MFKCAFVHLCKTMFTHSKGAKGAKVQKVQMDCTVDKWTSGQMDISIVYRSTRRDGNIFI